MKSFIYKLESIIILVLLVNVYAKDKRFTTIEIFTPKAYSGSPPLKDKSDQKVCGDFYRYSVSNGVFINDPFPFRFRYAHSVKEINVASMCRQRIYNIQDFKENVSNQFVNLSEKTKDSQKSNFDCNVEFPKNIDQADEKMHDRCGYKYNGLFCGNPKAPYCQFDGTCLKEQKSTFPNATKYDYRKISKYCKSSKSNGKFTRRRTIDLNSKTKTPINRNNAGRVIIPENKLQFQVIHPKDKTVDSTGYFLCNHMEELKITLTDQTFCELCQIEQTIQDTAPKGFKLRQCAAVELRGILNGKDAYRLPNQQFSNTQEAQKWLDKYLNNALYILEFWGFILTIVLSFLLGQLILILTIYTYRCKNRTLYSRMDNEDVPATFLDGEKELYY